MVILQLFVCNSEAVQLLQSAVPVSSIEDENSDLEQVSSSSCRLKWPRQDFECGSSTEIGGGVQPHWIMYLQSCIWSHFRSRCPGNRGGLFIFLFTLPHGTFVLGRSTHRWNSNILKHSVMCSHFVHGNLRQPIISTHVAVIPNHDIRSTKIYLQQSFAKM